MYLEEPDLKAHATFKKIIQVLKIINTHAAKLHYTRGVSECGQCKGTPTKHVTLPFGHVVCEGCLKEFIQQKEGMIGSVLLEDADSHKYRMTS